MRRIAAAAALTGVLALAGCGTPTEGFVERKDAHPKQEKTLVIEFRHGDVPLRVDTPECYEIEVLVAGKTEPMCIDQDEWQDIVVGQFYREGEQ